ncbi:MAG: DUF4375 domain-containing protein [Chloroflexota bacterium]
MFKNINLPTSMTKEFIDKISDTELIMVMLGYIAREFKDGEEPQDFFSRLPKGYKYISYVLNILDAQISNGGFNQFFFNDYEETIPEQLEALTLFKANKHKNIFEQAIKIYQEEKQNSELQTLYKKKALEAFSASYEITKLNSLDDKWYALEKELDRLIIKFIRNNPNLFVAQSSL